MIHNSFSSGNVYIIDDQIGEAQPIINSLYKHHIPHVFSDGSRSSLPKIPKQVRLIFLDLNLLPSMNPEDKKSFKGLHAQILNQLLANNSSSYLILIWSKQEDTYLNDFKEVFSDNTYGLKNRAPLEIISLDKKDYFSESSDENGDTIYSWKDEQEKQLFDLIEKKLSENESFKLLSTWETLIKKSGSKTVDYLFELVNGETKEEINLKLSDIITSLSISLLGQKNFRKSDNQQKTDGFMLALSELIDDEIDREIILEPQMEYTKWAAKPNLDEVFKSKINAKLLLSIETAKKELTGSLFKVDINRHDYFELFKDGIDITKNSQVIAELNEINKEITKGNKMTEEIFISNLCQEYYPKNKVIPIELNITPLCDVVQKKEKYYRMIPGILVCKDLAKYLHKGTDRNFVSPLIFIDSLNDSFVILLDFRYFNSINLDELNKLNKIFSLRKSFVDDIQMKLSTHISRLGILNL